MFLGSSNLELERQEMNWINEDKKIKDDLDNLDEILTNIEIKKGIKSAYQQTPNFGAN